MSTHPVGVPIGVPAVTPASTTATRTWPAATDDGRVTVSAEAVVAACVTASAAGSAFTARTDPDDAAATARARTIRAIQRFEPALSFELRECERAAPLVRSSFFIFPPS